MDEVSHNYPEGLSEYLQIGEEFGRWTDDTDMMLCIAKSIIADKDVKPLTVAHNFKEWYKSSPADIGGTTARILSLFEYEDTNAAVTCAVLGAKYGKKGIPEYYIQNLKRKDEYEEMTRQLTDILVEKFI